MPRYHFPKPHIPVSTVKKEYSPVPEVYKTALETHFPNILETIQTMWGYKELNAYFSRLTMDDRGSREGFPPSVWDEIHTLSNLHHHIVPEVVTFSSRHAYA